MSDGITASRAEVMETVYELACLLNTGLDRDTLAILMALIQKDSNGSCQERTYTGGKQPLSTQELQKKRRSDY
ncbi:Protein of unknown function DUF3743 [Plasmopara halstedii]|uniref:Mitotic-spindle organizing protein 1 n=1 Tax=Plasmopara halstedii TaxID=4781 RepID=A0A0P1AGA7_PLAHL|nr:Protein of unknown function DUF3743 [Plasmopara halstedii]CEG39492.1 Protein of unknown function DUF3743 [Plasmopara halstedii]|eukprot:XP_024575861.1 Protein of unknown function DUF3743 [Plasmopara halstedii]